MKFLSLLLNVGSCMFVGYIFYVFHKVKKRMFSKAWVIIHASFIILVSKWIYDAWLLYTYSNIDIWALIHEILTLCYAIVAAIGYTIFCNDFLLATRSLNKHITSSADTHKIIKEDEILSKTLVKDLQENG